MIKTQANRSVIFPRLCGLATACVAMTVLFGWYTRNEGLIQVLPHFAPMQYNTAIGLLLLGLGLVALTFRFVLTSSILGGACSLLGGLTLLEYILGVNFGLDEFFMEAYVNVKTTHPGRMAPSTALCFTLLGLVLSVGHRDSRIQISLATSVIVLSVLALVGYLSNISGLYGWGNLTRMALHTALSFLVLAAGLLALVPSGPDKTSKDLWQTMPTTLSAVVLILSLFFSYGIRESSQIRNMDYFNGLVSDTEHHLLERYGLYQQSLLGGVGLFHASEKVSRAEWNAYVNALNIEETLPGIAGLGFVKPVQEEALSSFLQTVREDAAPTFNAYPDTDFEDKFIIKFIEPEDFNAKALGLDIGFEKNRRTAAETSRDKGVPELTRKIVLVQDGQQTPGFLLLVPVYFTNDIPDTQGERRSQLRGWVYAPFIASNFMDGLSEVAEGQISFDVYDGEEVSPETLIYSSFPETLPLSRFSKQTSVSLAEQDWTINWRTTDEFTPPTRQNLSFIALIFGLLLATLLYLTLRRFLRSKEIIAQEVEKQTHKLVESENRLKLVFNNAGEGIIGLGLDGRTVFANKAARQLLGYSLEELQEAPLHQLIQHSHADGTRHAKEDGRFYASITDGTTHLKDTEVFWHKDGRSFPIEYSSEPIKDDNQKISGAVIVFRDIAERKAAEEEIKQANAELEEFAYRTSHDLRSPLVSSIGLLGIAERAMQSDNKEKALTSLNMTQKSLQTLEVLVRDILVLTQTKNEEEEEEAVQFASLIQGAIDKIRYMDHFDRIEIQQDLKFDEELTLKKNRIILILENLLSNAVKYQDLDKEKSWVKISTIKLNETFVLQVEDNGLGVPDDQQQHLFKMFKRFHPRTAFGSGLGLYMMKKSVNILGGEITFEDSGAGSIFKVSIPLSH
jgi:PAS domain S-box-containing protein